MPGFAIRHQQDNHSFTIRRTKLGGVAAIVGTATLRDITVKNAPVTVNDAVQFMVNAADNGEASTDDAINFTVLKSDGGFWIAAGWNGVQAIDQKVIDGNLQVHYGK